MLGALKFAWTSLQLMGGTAATIAMLWLAAQSLFHLRLLNVQTGSMQPSFRPHDALIMQRITPDKLKPGMIVSYKSPRSPSELVTHRVVKLTKGGFQTKGDAVTTPDPVVRGSLLTGRVVVVLPGMGRPLDWLRSWAGLAACVYLPAAAIGISELIKLEKHYAGRRMYHLSRA